MSVGLYGVSANPIKSKECSGACIWSWRRSMNCWSPAFYSQRFGSQDSWILHLSEIGRSGHYLRLWTGSVSCWRCGAGIPLAQSRHFLPLHSWEEGRHRVRAMDMHYSTSARIPPSNSTKHFYHITWYHHRSSVLSVCGQGIIWFILQSKLFCELLLLR